MNDQQREASALTQDLNAAYSQGEAAFRRKLNDILVRSVDRIYWDKDGDETKQMDEAYDSVFKPLAYFMLFGQANSDEMPEQTHGACCKIIRPGKPTYVCRNSGNYQQVLLCEKCYNQGDHSLHQHKDEVRFHSGRFCQCGLFSRSANDGHCGLHSGVDTDIAEKAEVGSPGWPDDITRRRELVFGELLRHACDVLRAPTRVKLPKVLTAAHDRLRSSSNEVAVMRYSGSGDVSMVADLLPTTIPRSLAIARARRIVSQGSGPIFFGTREECRSVMKVVRVKSRAKKGHWFDFNTGIRSYEAHRWFAHDILDWIVRTARTSEPFRKLFTRILTTPLKRPQRYVRVANQDSNFSFMRRAETLLELAVDAGHNLYKDTGFLIAELVLLCLSTEAELRLRLATQLANFFPQIVRDNSMGRSFCIDYSASHQMLDALLRIPAVGKAMIIKDRIYSIIFRAIAEEMKNNVVDGILRCNYEQGCVFLCLALSTELLLSDVFTSSHMDIQRDEGLNAALQSAFTELLHVLDIVQNAEAISRLTTEHADVEPLYMFSNDILRTFDSWLDAVKDIVSKNDQTYVDYLNVAYSAFDRRRRKSSRGVISYGQEAIFIRLDTRQDELSFFSPLNRLTANFCLSMPADGTAIEYWNDWVRANNLKDLCYESLKLQVMTAQVRAGMWKRNGLSVEDQIKKYKYDRKMGNIMFEGDIAAIQVSASLQDPNQFVLNCITLFGVLHYTSHITGLDLSILDTMTDEFLNLIIVITGERWRTGISCVTNKDILRHHLIQKLALGMYEPQEMEALVKEKDKELVSDIIREIAIPNASSKRWLLKRELFLEVNPHYYLYDIAEQDRVRENQMTHMRAVKKDGSQTEGTPLAIPMPPPFAKRFENIRGIFYSEALMGFIKSVLGKMQSHPVVPNHYHHFQNVLQIISLALHEDRREYTAGDHSMKFLSLLKEGGNGSLFSLLQTTAAAPQITCEITRELLCWVIRYMTAIEVLKETGAYQEPTSYSFCNQNLENQGSIGQEMNTSSTQKKLQENFMSRFQKRFARNISLIAAKDSAEKSQSASTSSALPKTHQEASSVNAIGEDTCSVCIMPVSANDGCAVTLFTKSSVLAQDSKTINKNRNMSLWFCRMDIPFGLYIYTCGHVIHYHCAHDLYGPQSPHLKFYEGYQVFTCPACQKTGNYLQPILSSPRASEEDVRPVNFSAWWSHLLELTGTASPSESRQPEPHCTTDRAGNELPGESGPCQTSQTESLNQIGDCTQFCINLSTEQGYMLRQLSETICEYYKGLDSSMARHPALWRGCAYMIQVHEENCRRNGKPLFTDTDGEAGRRMSSLRNLIYCAAASPKDIRKITVEREFMRLISALVGTGSQGYNLRTRAYPRRRPGFQSFLNLDLWNSFVFACFSSRTVDQHQLADAQNNSPVYPVFVPMYQYFLRLFFVGHIIQVMLMESTYTRFCFEAASDLEDPTELIGRADASFAEHANRVYAAARSYNIMGSCRKAGDAGYALLEKIVEESCMPFLRCAMLMCTILKNAPPVTESASFKVICYQLGLQTKISDFLLKNSLVFEQVLHSLALKDGEEIAENLRSYICYPITARHLINLPGNYRELLKIAANYRCPNGGNWDSERLPVQCLLCGTVTCARCRCCDSVVTGRGRRQRAAHLHAISCGGGSCLFLRLTRSDVVMVSELFGNVSTQAPYVDEYGYLECRASPSSKLSRTTYEQLKRLWYDHTMHSAALEASLKELQDEDQTLRDLL